MTTTFLKHFQLGEKGATKEKSTGIWCYCFSLRQLHDTPKSHAVRLPAIHGSFVCAAPLGQRLGSAWHRQTVEIGMNTKSAGIAPHLLGERSATRKEAEVDVDQVARLPTDTSK